MWFSSQPDLSVAMEWIFDSIDASAASMYCLKCISAPSKLSHPSESYRRRRGPGHRRLSRCPILGDRFVMRVVLYGATVWHIPGWGEDEQLFGVLRHCDEAWHHKRHRLSKARVHARGLVHFQEHRWHVRRGHRRRGCGCAAACEAPRSAIYGL